MRTLTFQLSSEMDQYGEDIEKFVDLMIAKLHKNVHKGRWEDLDVYGAFDRLEEEVGELLDEIKCGNRDGAFLEAADVANFAMIIASILRERGNGNGEQYLR